MVPFDIPWALMPAICKFWTPTSREMDVSMVDRATKAKMAENRADILTILSIRLCKELVCCRESREEKPRKRSPRRVRRLSYSLLRRSFLSPLVDSFKRRRTVE